MLLRRGLERAEDTQVIRETLPGHDDDDDDDGMVMLMMAMIGW